MDDVGISKLHGSQLAEPSSANKASQISPMGPSQHQKMTTTAFPVLNLMPLYFISLNPTESPPYPHGVHGPNFPFSSSLSVTVC